MTTEEPTRPKVLAIDDSDLVHRLLRARLRHERIDLHSVQTAEEGIRMARELTPEVILLDIDLEDLDDPLFGDRAIGYKQQRLDLGHETGVITVGRLIHHFFVHLD